MDNDIPAGNRGVRQLNKAADEAATDATKEQTSRYKFEKTDKFEADSAKIMVAAMQRIVLGQLHAQDEIPDFLTDTAVQQRTFW